MINHISIVGGTHGNEYTGVFLLQMLRAENYPAKFPELDIELIDGNPKAFEEARRFIDKDLNRSFGMEELSDHSLGGYEANRAKVINQYIGPKNNARTDFIIDLHTTTSNMGVTLILREGNDFNLKCCAYVKERMPNVFVYYLPWNGDPQADHPFLNSITPYGICLEVGPIANAVVRHETLEQTHQAVELMMEFINLHNQEVTPELPDQLEVFSYCETVKYPLDSEKQLAGFIHKDLQDRDFQPLNKGDKVFQMIDGSVVKWDRKESLYPLFINEAAYYYQHKAFSLTEKLTLNID